MSSNHPHTTIHLGNYEEFFLLYIDGELSPEDMTAVDEFVAAHPDLRAELDLLNGARLTPEPVSFPKEELLSHHMAGTVIDEALLLYMDNELTAEGKARVEEDLTRRPDYRRQLDELLAARLDRSQTIAYPNKKELYRREERRAAFPWLRAAAAVVVVALGGLLYLNRSTGNGNDLARLDNNGSKAKPTATFSQPAKKEASNLNASATGTQALAANVNPNVAHPATIPGHQEKESRRAAQLNKINDHSATKPNVNDNGDMAQTQGPEATTTTEEAQRPKQLVASLSQGSDNRLSAVALKPALVVASGINNSPVTFVLPNRTTTNDAAAPAPINPADVAARNDHKGSVKGFLRRATRLIEKRTGVDPTNDGELLIGVVAVKLK